ncbi:hypothetical protein GRI40_09965 [Altererythrobacter aerius]|uniref:PilZ domain-containing protein n=1 Tax=Tsuneonella aeria TaxID=1837929 RepID=A0A6I4TE07_9SPHN|nr:PilZ domain-containing protein [Tsuneonella aeria]MXO75541.1 hypothetical protein [Tsuneonella aeria]
MSTDSIHGDRRAEPRFDTRIDGRIRSSKGARFPVQVEDLSATGCRISMADQYVAASSGWALKIGGLEALGGEMAWISEGSAGIRFSDPLHPAIVSHLVAANPPPEDESAD